MKAKIIIKVDKDNALCDGMLGKGETPVELKEQSESLQGVPFTLLWRQMKKTALCWPSSGWLSQSDCAYICCAFASCSLSTRRSLRVSLTSSLDSIHNTSPLLSLLLQVQLNLSSNLSIDLTSQTHPFALKWRHLPERKPSWKSSSSGTAGKRNLHCCACCMFYKHPFITFTVWAKLRWWTSMSITSSPTSTRPQSVRIS